MSETISGTNNLDDVTAANPPFRLLILGGGAIVTECHLPALRVLGWLDQCTVVEPFERNAQLVRDRFPEATVTARPYEQVLAEEAGLKRFDGVLIALPNTLHADASVRCLRAGLPVLCEKPLALTAEECRMVDHVALTHGIPIFVGMVRRFTPSLVTLRAALSQGVAGELKSVVLEQGSSYGLWPSDTETVLRRDQGGCLVNMGIHFLDYLEWMFGKLSFVSYSDDFAGGVEVNCELRLKTGEGLPVEVRISWTHALSNTLRLEGTKGTLIMNLGEFATVQWHSLDGELTASLQAFRPFQSGDWQHTFEACFVEQFWQFAKAVRSNPTAGCLVRPIDAIHCHELIEQAYRSRITRISASSTKRESLEPASVVVTGGTGFVGSHLVQRLSELGMTSITVPVRSFRTGAQIARYPMNMKRTDLTSVESCREAFRGARHVFHLAYGSSGADADNITVTGTRNVLQAALAEGVESVVVFGTCTIWAGYGDVVVTEEMTPRPILGDYGSTKAKMQAECLAFARENPQIRVSVVAPGAVYGPRGALFCTTPCTAAKAGLFAWYDGGRGICNYVHVSNLVDLAILAAKKTEAHGHCFIAVDGQTTWREFLMPLVEPWAESIQELSSEQVQAMKARPSRTGSLKDVLRAVLGSARVMAALSNHPLLGAMKDEFTHRFPAPHQRLQQMRPAQEFIAKPPVVRPEPTLWMADVYGAGTVRFSSAKARAVLGWQPLVGLRDGLKTSVDWLREVGLRD